MNCPARWWITTFAFAFCISGDFAQAGIETVQPSSLVVIRGTHAGQSANDCADADCSSGPVAKAIVAALQNPAMTIAGLFDQVNAKVAIATNGAQTPTLTAWAATDVPLYEKGRKSLALVIGNGTYAHFPALRGSPRDADIVGKRLGEMGFQTMTLVNAQGEPLKTAIRVFLESLGSGDTAVLYYSGHGYSADGVEYLPPLDGRTTEVDALRKSSIDVAELAAEMSRSKAGRKLLILDTHFPGLTPASNR
jgi:uncharacterized caspase-like protein